MIGSFFLGNPAYRNPCDLTQHCHHRMAIGLCGLIAASIMGAYVSQLGKFVAAQPVQDRLFRFEEQRVVPGTCQVRHCCSWGL